jgi:hypothetical protein
MKSPFERLDRPHSDRPVRILTNGGQLVSRGGQRNKKLQVTAVECALLKYVIVTEAMDAGASGCNDLPFEKSDALQPGWCSIYAVAPLCAAVETSKIVPR